MRAFSFAFRRSGATRDDAGFALVAVIWIGILLATTATILSASARAYLRSTEASVSTAEAQAAADAGVSIAILAALRREARAQTALVLNGQDVTCRLPSGDHVTMRLRDEAGRVDLNTARTELLTTLLVGMGLPLPEAQIRAEAIVDYRDSDASTQGGAREASLYEASGRSDGPKNAPFIETEELFRVAGFEGDLVRRLLPVVTVHSGQDGVDPVAATPSLLEILKSGARRVGGAGLENDREFGEFAGAVQPFAIQSAQRAIRIEAEAQTTREARFVREAVVELVTALPADRRQGESRSRSQARGMTYRLLRWRRGERFTSETELAQFPPC